MSKDYTGIIDFRMNFVVHGRGGNSEVLKSAIRQQVAGLITDIRKSGLEINEFSLDSGDSEKISEKIEEMLQSAT